MGAGQAEAGVGAGAGAGADHHPDSEVDLVPGADPEAGALTGVDVTAGVSLRAEVRAKVEATLLTAGNDITQDHHDIGQGHIAQHHGGKRLIG